MAGFPEILEKDIAYFKKAGINEVSLGIFSWAVLEPHEGEFHFAWMQEIINRLYENDISVILATPSGARPKWMADKYPEVLRVEADRHRNLFGEGIITAIPPRIQGKGQNHQYKAGTTVWKSSGSHSLAYFQ